MPKILDSKIRNLIHLTLSSFEKFKSKNGIYKGFEEDNKKIKGIKKEIVKFYNNKTKNDFLSKNIINESTKEINNQVLLDSLAKELSDLDKEIENVVIENLNKISGKKEAKAIEQNQKDKVRLEKKQKQVEKTSKKILKNISTPVSSFEYKKYIAPSAFVLIGFLILSSIFGDEEPKYNKNNPFVKHCLSIGFTSNKDVASCVSDEKRRAEDQAQRRQEQAQRDAYNQQLIQEQQRANDNVTNQMLMDMSKSLLGLNNRPAPRTTCIYTINGMICQ